MRGRVGRYLEANHGLPDRVTNIGARYHLHPTDGMMVDMDSWLEKDDDDLTAEDVDQMWAAAEPIEIVGPSQTWVVDRPASTVGPGLQHMQRVTYPGRLTSLTSA